METQEKNNKTSDINKYMREYMKERRKKNNSDEKTKNRCAYYKRNYKDCFTDEELEKYKLILDDIYLIKQLLKKYEANNKDLLVEFLGKNL